VRRGRTPAQLDELPAGEYVVQFSRAGWPDRTERVTVKGGATARVGTTFQGGTVTINSSPTGATVLQGGLLLGKTPLTLGGVPPQNVSYELSLHGYETLRVSGTVAEGRGLELNGTLLDLNRLVNAEEVRTPPRPYKTTPLGLGRIPRSAPPYITVSFVVLPNGSLEDVKVLGTVDPKLARRSVDAIEKWKFFPGVSHAGYPVKVRMSMPIKIADG
jgi:TonB family protein